MKQTENNAKKQTYQAPRAEVVNMESVTVLCGSAMNGNSTENVGINGFDWI